MSNKSNERIKDLIQDAAKVYSAIGSNFTKAANGRELALSDNENTVVVCSYKGQSEGVDFSCILFDSLMVVFQKSDNSISKMAGFKNSNTIPMNSDEAKEISLKIISDDIHKIQERLSLS